MQGQGRSRRPSGTGSLFVRTDRSGRKVWYAKWRQGPRQAKRSLGPVREAGSSTGLTRGGAEAELRRLLADAAVTPAPAERLTLAAAGERYLAHVDSFRGRKRTTVKNYRIVLRRHLGPYFAGRSLEAIDRRAVEAYQRAKLAEGLSPKTVSNHVRFLHGVFRYAIGQEWALRNPVAGIEHPGERTDDHDLRALGVEELEALLRAVPSDHLGATDRVLYLTAAMTGLRKGELQALRWMDVDWPAGVIRVRRSYGGGEFTAPKSRRSTRAVPMADAVAQELARFQQRSPYAGEHDLVFAHPHSGRPYDASKILKRFKAAMAAAGLRDARFHDLRHTFGTRMAAAGAPLRFIQEWMGHRDYKTTSIYADYAPDPSQGAAYARRAFAIPGRPEDPGGGEETGTILSQRPGGGV
jgi:integrase